MTNEYSVSLQISKTTTWVDFDEVRCQMSRTLVTKGYCFNKYSVYIDFYTMEDWVVSKCESILTRISLVVNFAYL